MKIGDKYNWRNQPERLSYLGKKGAWHQFKKTGDSREVWCEVLDSDLPMMEETAPLAQPARAPLAWIEHHKAGDNRNWVQVDHPYAKATPLCACAAIDAAIKETP